MLFLFSLVIQSKPTTSLEVQELHGLLKMTIQQPITGSRLIPLLNQAKSKSFDRHFSSLTIQVGKQCIDVVSMQINVVQIL